MGGSFPATLSPPPGLNVSRRPDSDWHNTFVRSRIMDEASPISSPFIYLSDQSNALNSFQIYFDTMTWVSN